MVAAVTNWDLGSHSRLRCWFRGQGDADWDLQPKLYRGRDSQSAEEILATERQLVRDFRLLSASIRSGEQEDSDLYLLEQHYGVATRLLDWTTHPLIALYFACEGPKDGKVFFLDAFTLVKSKQPNGKNFGIATARRGGFRAWIAHIFDWVDKTPDPKIEETFPIQPEHFDRRITLQQGCFTFHVPASRAIPEAALAKSFLIPSKRKSHIRNNSPH